MKKQRGISLFFCFARGQGFEPRYAASKAAVLPLDDPRIFIDFKKTQPVRFIHFYGIFYTFKYFLMAMLVVNKERTNTTRS